MDVIRAQLLKIQQQLSGLTASQKMLTLSLVAIMVMTVVWWARFAGTAEMVPIIDATLSPADVAQIQAALAASGIDTKLVGDRVMVPADRKFEAVAKLAWSNAIPAAGGGGANVWDDMIKMMNTWDTTPKTQAILNHTKESMLAYAMTSFFPGVAKANVIINFVSERHVGGSLEPSASVQIATKANGGSSTRALTEAVASTVATAVPGLRKSRISIVIDGMPHHAQEEGDGFIGGDVYDRTVELEKSNAEKITSLLPEGSIVAVKVNIETASTQSTREAYDEKTTLVKEKSSDTQTQETTQPPQGGSEPGAKSNLELSLPAAPMLAAAGPSNTMEKSKTENQIFPGVTREVVSRPAGNATVVSAAVRIPRSFFVRKYKANATVAASTKEPDDNAIQPIFDSMVPRFRKVVQNCADIKSEDAISIDMCDDFDSPMIGGASIVSAVGDSASGGAAGIGALLGGHVKELALGILAVVSLFMVSMIVKKGPQAALAFEEAGPKETPKLAGSEALAGIVGGENNTPLDGMELDEEAVKAQQVVEQVATLVKEDPDAAANLVKRWLNRS